MVFCRMTELTAEEIGDWFDLVAVAIKYMITIYEHFDVLRKNLHTFQWFKCYIIIYVVYMYIAPFKTTLVTLTVMAYIPKVNCTNWLVSIKAITIRQKWQQMLEVWSVQTSLKCLNGIVSISKITMFHYCDHFVASHVEFLTIQSGIWDLPVWRPINSEWVGVGMIHRHWAQVSSEYKQSTHFFVVGCFYVIIVLMQVRLLIH